MNSLLPVVILAGGLATRLKPVTETIPKALIAVNGEPFIHHQLRLLHFQGIREVILCVSFLGEMIESAIGNGNQFGLNVKYSYDGPKLLGTGGAIKQACHLLPDYFFVLYGDSYLTCSYFDVQAAFQASNKKGLMTLFNNQGQWDTSNVEFQNGKIISYDKVNRTKDMHHIDYGLGILGKASFIPIQNHQPFDLTEIYQQLLLNGNLAAYEVLTRFYEVGSFAGIKELEYYLSTVESCQKASLST